MAIDITAPRPVQFTIGRALRDTFDIFRSNFLGFTAVGILAHLPRLLIPRPSGEQIVRSLGHFDWSVQIVLPLVGLVMASLVQAAVIFGTLQNLRGQKASLNDMGHGLSFVPLLIIAGAVIAFPSWIALMINSMLGGSLLTMGLVQAVFGLVSLVLYVMCWVSAPAIAVERNGVLAGLARSAQLTKGRRWSIVGLLILFGLVGSGAGLVIAKLGGPTLAELGRMGPTTFAGIALFVVTAWVSVLRSVLITVGYYHLRTEKEGFGIEEVARIFE